MSDSSAKAPATPAAPPAPPPAAKPAAAKAAPAAPARVPVVGERIMYRGTDEEGHYRFFAAVVTDVHSATEIDLHVFYGRFQGGDVMAEGERRITPQDRLKVPLLDQGLAATGDSVGWCWA